MIQGTQRPHLHLRQPPPRGLFFILGVFDLQLSPSTAAHSSADDLQPVYGCNLSSIPPTETQFLFVYLIPVKVVLKDTEPRSVFVPAEIDIPIAAGMSYHGISYDGHLISTLFADYRICCTGRY